MGFFSLSFSSLWQTKPWTTTALLRTISVKGLSQLKVIVVASLCMLQKDIFSCREVHYCSCRRCWNTDISSFSWLLHCVFMHHSCAMLFHPKDLYTMHFYWLFFFSNVISPEPAVIHWSSTDEKDVTVLHGAWSYLQNLDPFFPDQMMWVGWSGAAVLVVAFTGLSLPPTSAVFSSSELHGFIFCSVFLKGGFARNRDVATFLNRDVGSCQECVECW